MAPPLFEIGLDIGRVFVKCLIFDEFILWLIYRLSKSTYASQLRGGIPFSAVTFEVTRERM